MTESCFKCGNVIDKDRFDFLVEFSKPLVCISCSNEEKSIGLMEFSHKTAPELVRLSSNPESKRRAFRAFKRSR